MGAAKVFGNVFLSGHFCEVAQGARYARSYPNFLVPATLAALPAHEALMFDSSPSTGSPRRVKQRVDDLDEWTREALASIKVTSRPDPDDQWSPKLVGEALIEALRWARYAAGKTGPAGYTGMRLPEALLSPEDRLALGWDAAIEADPEDARSMRVQLSSAQVSRHEAALEWAANYLCPDHHGSARMVGLWAASKAYRRSFDGALKARGVGRSLAYRMRDRGLSLIAQGLDRDGALFDI